MGLPQCEQNFSLIWTVAPQFEQNRAGAVGAGVGAVAGAGCEDVFCSPKKALTLGLKR